MINTSIGKMRHRITFQRAISSTVAGGSGDEIKTWTPYASRVAAKVTPISAGEVVDGAQQKATATDQVNTRYLCDVRPTDRIIYHAADGDRILNIERIVDLQERRVELEIACERAA